MISQEIKSKNSHAIYQTSTRDTTPFVTEIVSPPRGYPTTVTESFKLEKNKYKPKPSEHEF